MIVGRNKLEIRIQRIASHQLFRIRMAEGNGGCGRIACGGFDGRIENQRGHDILQDSAVRRRETADMAVLHDGGAMRILLQEEMRAAIGRATADRGRMFAESTEISGFTAFEMAVSCIEVSFVGAHGDAAVAEFAAGNDAVVVVEMAQKDTCSGIFKEAVFDAMFRAGRIDFHTAGHDCGLPCVFERAVAEEVVALEGWSAHVDAGTCLVCRIELHADDAGLQDAGQAEHRLIDGAIPDDGRVTAASDDGEAARPRCGIQLIGAVEERLRDAVAAWRQIDRAALTRNGGHGALERRRVVRHTVADRLHVVPCVRRLDIRPIRTDLPWNGRDLRRGEERNIDQQKKEEEVYVFHFQQIRKIIRGKYPFCPCGMIRQFYYNQSHMVCKHQDGILH